MEENRENGRIRSPTWGLFYKKHKKISLFLKKNAQKLASFEKYAYFCNMKKSPGWRYHKNNKELVDIKTTRYIRTIK